MRYPPLFCTIYTILYNLHYSVQFTLFCVIYTILYNLHYSVQFALFCTICTILYNLHYSVQFALFCTICTIRLYAALLITIYFHILSCHMLHYPVLEHYITHVSHSQHEYSSHTYRYTRLLQFVIINKVLL